MTFVLLLLTKKRGNGKGENSMKLKVYHLSKTQRVKIAFYLMLFAFAFFFLLLFSFCTSPLFSTYNGADSAFFCLVGKGMTKGYLPYRDFFDTKGPYFFLIEYLGQLLSYGRRGIFLVQWINLSLVILLICNLCEQFGIHSIPHQLLLLISCAWVASAAFEEGNLTEEFSLVPLCLCLNLSVRYFRKSFGSKKSHSVYYGAVYGACFAFLSLVRITNAALICAIVFTICIDLIINRNWRDLLYNAASFVAGFAAVFIPMLLFYASQGQAIEMLYAVFVFGFKYSAENNFVQHLQMILSSPGYFFLVVLPAVLAVCTPQKDWRLRLLSVSGSIATFIAIASGNLYLHYFTLAIPLLVISELLIWDTIQSVKNVKPDARIKNCIVLLLSFFLLLFSLQAYYNPVNYTLRKAKSLIQSPDYTTGQNIRDIVEHITESERDRVFCYNLNPDWYIYADLFPYIKYCGWHNHYIILDPRIELELEQIFKTTPPKWVVLPENIGWLPSFLSAELKTRYVCSYSNEAFWLYKLADAAV